MVHLRHAFTRAAAAVAALALLLAGAWGLVEWSADGAITTQLDALRPAEAGLVLGTSRWMRRGTPNPFFVNRIDAAAALYRSGKVKYLIVSGNQSEGGHGAGGYDEPTDMRDALLVEGVPAKAIYRDYAGFRTLHSVLRAHEVFEQDRVIIVSQHFHLARALFLAKRHGLQDEGYEAADPPLWAGLLTKIREAGARVKALIDVLDRRDARFGGKTIALGVDPPT
jgi:SanA protein